ncbi:hypothetical protein [Candidatus Deferrimicrobium sp.]|uniref:hypothetical protein n=1 Tax=Candidatus Deferrimicrobium sp. TaxID=3060586 RepID=UPI002ED97B33
MNCPICGWEHFPAAGRGRTAPAKGGSCPYKGTEYAELRAGHDQIYFGRWRGMDANSIDLRRAYHQLGRLLRDIAVALEKEDVPAARLDLGKAFDALRGAGPGVEGPEALRHLDHALSYAHRVIGDLLHEKGLAPHSPADFAGWFDAAEVPFREDW